MNIKNNYDMCLFQGKLVGHGVEDKMPTIAIVAYYDSFGVAPVSVYLNKVKYNYSICY